MVRRRSGMRLVYVGDVGTIVPPTPVQPLPQNINLDNMEWREIFLVAIEMGIPIQKLIGVNSCIEHADMVPLGANKLPDGMNYAEHTSYCNNCFVFFRMKRLP